MRIAGAWRVSKHIRHVVTEIVAPWGPGIEERPRVLSEVERVEMRTRKREGKVERRRGRKGEEGGEVAEVVEEV